MITHTKLPLTVLYLLMGGITTALYFMLFLLFWSVLGIHKSLAVSLAYGLFIFLNFSAHRRFTFQAQHHMVGQQFLRYLVLVGGNYFVTLVIVHFSTEVLHWSPAWGVIWGAGITTIVGYFLSKSWVYNKPLRARQHG